MGLLAASGHLVRPLLIVTAVALAGWFAVLEMLAVATRPRQPEPGPATLIDLTSDSEPPAVANYLTNHWAVGDDAMAATLIDLAARHYLSIDELGPDRFVCRVQDHRVQDDHARSDETLNPYEQQMLDRIRGVAVDGAVPCEALATGLPADSDAWCKRFKDAVVADAKARGLSRNRWSSASHVVLGVTALGPSVSIAALIMALPASSNQSSSSVHHHSPGLGAAIFAGIFVWFVLMGVMSVYRAQRETPAGSAAAARWLGLREHLHSDPAFSELPPAAVAIWDRYLAYGAAVGVAAAAVHALPMGPESDHEAWSSYGGRWRVVHVTYPHHRRPGWGWHPVKALTFSILYGIGAVWLASGLLPAVTKRWLPNLRSSSVSWLWLAAVVVLAVFLGAMAYGAFAAVGLLGRGLVDLLSRHDFEGVVLRKRSFDDRYYVAVDENRGTKVRAWRVPGDMYRRVSQGQVVTGRVADQLGHLWRLESDHPGVVTPSRAQPAASTDAPGSLPADMTCRIGVDEVRSVTGCQLARVNINGAASASARPFGSKARVLEWAAYQAESIGRVMVGLLESEESGGHGLLGLMRWAPKRFFQPVPGVGDEAYWAGNTTLFARQGRHVSVAVVALRDVPSQRRLQMARIFAAKLLESTSQPAPG